VRNWEQALDRWLTTPPEPEEVTVAYCKYCDGDVFAGEEAYKVNVNEWVHDECFLDYAREELDVTFEIVEEPEPDWDAIADMRRDWE
jgi:hypothetical protein